MSMGTRRGQNTQSNITVVTTGASFTVINEAVVIVNKASGSATTLNLPQGSIHGNAARDIIFKDGKGDAATNNITITPYAGDTIDGGASLLINVNYGYAEIVWNGTQWNVVGAGASSTSGGQVVGNLVVTGLLDESTVNGLTAHAGGGQALGTPLTAMVNRVTTVGSAADSCLLPAAVLVSGAGPALTVINAGANSMNVFPGTGDIINALSANAAFAVAAGKTVTFFVTNAGQWHTQLSA